MELITGTTHQHSTHGEVRIESIHREYSVYESDTGDGHVPGGWFVCYSTGDETRSEPVGEFIDRITSDGGD